LEHLVQLIGIPYLPAKIIWDNIPKKEQTEPAAKKRKIDEDRSELILSRAFGFGAEGFHPENFYADRTTSMKNIIDSVKKYYQILLQSAPFTGKTWLWKYLEKYLNQEYKECEVIRISFLNYTPDERIEHYWNRKTGYDLKKLETTEDKIFFILIDEFQVLYCTDFNEALNEYRDSFNEELLRTFANDNDSFWKILKNWAQSTNHFVICFSGYGSWKRASKFTTPSGFGNITSQYAYYTEEEFDSLCDNFIKRSSFENLRRDNIFPQALKEDILTLTNYHVGFTSCILGCLNINFHKLPDENSMRRFLHSREMYQFLSMQRTVPNWNALSPDEQSAVKCIWRLENDMITSDPNYERLIRRGWIKWDDSHKIVSLHCPLYKQLLLMAMDIQVRSATDNYSKLTTFMDHFLERIPGGLLKQTLSVSIKDVDTILESYWQSEFYHIGTSLLSQSSSISVEVQKAQNLRLPGKIDFYIDDEKQWAVEFLIDGQLASTSVKDLSRAEEHVGRLTPGGKYSGIGKEWLVVDFRRHLKKGRIHPDSQKDFFFTKLLDGAL